MQQLFHPIQFCISRSFHRFSCPVATYHIDFTLFKIDIESTSMKYGPIQWNPYVELPKNIFFCQRCAWNVLRLLFGTVEAERYCIYSVENLLVEKIYPHRTVKARQHPLQKKGNANIVPKMAKVADTLIISKMDREDCKFLGKLFNRYKFGRFGDGTKLCILWWYLNKNAMEDISMCINDYLNCIEAISLS